MSSRPLKIPNVELYDLIEGAGDTEQQTDLEVKHPIFGPLPDIRQLDIAAITDRLFGECDSEPDRSDKPDSDPFHRQNIALAKKVQAGKFALSALERERQDPELAQAVNDKIETIHQIIEDAHQARNEMVMLNKGLGMSRIKKHYAARESLEFDDYKQEAMDGLAEAANRFDPSLGWKFSTYAPRWVDERLYKANYNINRTIRLPVHVEQRLSAIRAKTEAYEKAHDEKPSIETLAADLKLEFDVVKTKKLADQADVLSLQARIGDMDDSTTLEDLIADTPQEEAEDWEYAGVDVKKLMDDAGLNPKERHILYSYYGLDGSDEKTFSEIGEEYGQTLANMSLTHKNAIKKMRSAYTERTETARPQVD